MKKYRLTQISGSPGFCWFCSAKTRYILDDGRSEIFCCLNCVKDYCRNSRIQRRIQNLIKSKKTKNQKFLHIKNQKNSVISTKQRQLSNFPQFCFIDKVLEVQEDD